MASNIYYAIRRVSDTYNLYVRNILAHDGTYTVKTHETLSHVRLWQTQEKATVVAQSLSDDFEKYEVVEVERTRALWVKDAEKEIPPLREDAEREGLGLHQMAGVPRCFWYLRLKEKPVDRNLLPAGLTGHQEWAYAVVEPGNRLRVVSSWYRLMENVQKVMENDLRWRFPLTVVTRWVSDFSEVED